MDARADGEGLCPTPVRVRWRSKRAERTTLAATCGDVTPSRRQVTGTHSRATIARRLDNTCDLNSNVPFASDNDVESARSQPASRVGKSKSSAGQTRNNSRNATNALNGLHKSTSSTRLHDKSAIFTPETIWRLLLPRVRPCSRGWPSHPNDDHNFRKLTRHCLPGVLPGAHCPPGTWSCRWQSDSKWRC